MWGRGDWNEGRHATQCDLFEGLFPQLRSVFESLSRQGSFLASDLSRTSRSAEFEEFCRRKPSQASVGTRGLSIDGEIADERKTVNEVVEEVGVVPRDFAKKEFDEAQVGTLRRRCLKHCSNVRGRGFEEFGGTRGEGFGLCAKPLEAGVAGFRCEERGPRGETIKAVAEALREFETVDEAWGCEVCCQLEGVGDW